MNSITIASLEELDRAVSWLDQMILESDRTVVAFYADMGVGKTTLISRYAQIHGSQQQPSSPTFAIVNTYDTPRGVIFHFDLYRIDDRREAESLALAEYFYAPGATCLVEWPEKIEEFLPEELTLRIKMELTENGARKLSVVE